jgi:hypothetical protein
LEGGAITSDAGGPLLREVEKHTGIMERFAACFRDYRKPELIEHTVRDRGKALAGQSTLNRRELTKAELATQERSKQKAWHSCRELLTAQQEPPPK